MRKILRENSLTETEQNALFQLSIMANVINCWSFFLNLEQTSNDDLMKAIEKQNESMLDEVLANQKLILQELKDLKNKL